MFVLILVVCVLLSGWLSASETALFSLSSMRVRACLREGGWRGKEVAHLLAQPRKLLVTILMLNILMNILVQNMVSTIFGTFSHWGITVGVPFALTLIFGEVIPKSIGYQKNLQISLWTAPILRRVEWVLKPFRDCITSLANLFSSLLFGILRPPPSLSTKEFKCALHTSQSSGILNQEEATLIRGYLNLEDNSLKEIMTPLQKVSFFDLNCSLSELVHLFADKGCTHIPVCDGSPENLLGIITSYTYFLYQRVIHSSKGVLPYLIPPHFVPESTSGRSVLRQFYAHNTQVMMVIDEYSSISGMVTLKDVLEVVIGQMATNQEREQEPQYMRVAKNVIIANGTFELIEFEHIFDVQLISRHNMATVGGWLVEQIGEVPRGGYSHYTEQFLFHILSSDPRRIQQMYIYRLRSGKGRS